MATRRTRLQRQAGSLNTITNVMLASKLGHPVLVSRLRHGEQWQQTGRTTTFMEQVLLVFAIALLIWLGTGASRQARTTQPHALRDATHRTGDPRA